MKFLSLSLLSRLVVVVAFHHHRQLSINRKLTQDVFHGKSSCMLRTTELHGRETQDDESRDLDLFEYFDPLISPHAYPDGISPSHIPKPLERSRPSAAFGFRLENNVVTTAPIQFEARSSSRIPSQKPEFFDPLLSPHSYPNGTPDVVIGDSEFQSGAGQDLRNRRRRRVGILLIDHGSRNQESNLRLHQFAAMYQAQFFDDSTHNNPMTIVRAAHMEIAEPSIPEALRAMIEECNQELDEIICHPFFLSPLGRHVSVDIPQIVEDAKRDLAISIPITTTQPVGAEVNLILQAVHSLVSQSMSKVR